MFDTVEDEKVKHVILECEKNKRLKFPLHFHSLERRRARGDMIEVFKWVTGINKENIDQVLEFSSQERTHGNGYKLEKLRFRKT